MSRLPQADRIARLPLVDQHAAAELFRGTMARHSVVAYRDDDAAAARQPSFTGDAWRGYVPLRAPDTIRVQERLPPGAAAVLINRSHSFTDLYLPIDAQEQRLYAGIDGERSAGEIARAEADTDRAAVFFARLERYDQIVLDASR